MEHDGTGKPSPSPEIEACAQGASSRAFNFGPRAVTAEARTDSTGGNFRLVRRQRYRAFRFREKFLSAAFFPKESGEG
jgi:hypothetical protein